MKILTFNSQHDEIVSKIRHSTMKFQNCPVILTKNFHTFKKEFSSCLSGETLIVFFLNNELDMRFLESIRYDFVDIKLIIDISGGTQYQDRALKLHPRIITNVNENLDLLLGVIQGCLKENMKNDFLQDNSKKAIRS